MSNTSRWLDALPGLGHACGHNLIATVAVTGALATANIMKTEKLGGKVILFGTPAEESKPPICPLVIMLCFLGDLTGRFSRWWR